MEEDEAGRNRPPPQLTNPQDTCPICFEEWYPKIYDGVPLVILSMPCGHWFDGDCIQAWVTNNSTCPTCRRERTDQPLLDVTAELESQYWHLELFGAESLAERRAEDQLAREAAAAKVNEKEEEEEKEEEDNDDWPDDQEPTQDPNAPLPPFDEDLLGRVVWFHAERGYGFIRPHRGRYQWVFVHYSAILRQGYGYQNLEAHQRVRFSVTVGMKGLQAVDVIPL